MLKLYDYLPSQNGFKIRLLLQHLGQPYQHVPVAIFQSVVPVTPREPMLSKASIFGMPPSTGPSTRHQSPA